MLVNKLFNLIAIDFMRADCGYSEAHLGATEKLL